MSIKLRNRKRRLATFDDKTARLTSVIKRAMIGLALVVFAAFFMIGFTNTDMMIPDYNAPRLTGLLITTMIIFLTGGMTAVVWSAVKTAKTSRKETGETANSHSRRRLMILIFIITALIMAATFMLCPAEKMTINYQPFTDTFSIRLANMFITTAATMLTAAIIAIIAGRFISRKHTDADKETAA